MSPFGRFSCLGAGDNRFSLGSTFLPTVIRRKPGFFDDPARVRPPRMARRGVFSGSPNLQYPQNSCPTVLDVVLGLHFVSTMHKNKRAKALKDKGFTADEIAAALNISPRSVFNYLKE